MGAKVQRDFSGLTPGENIVCRCEPTSNPFECATWFNRDQIPSSSSTTQFVPTSVSSFWSSLRSLSRSHREIEHSQNKLVQLENRVVGDGVTIRSFTFQSLDDVRFWCRQHLPTHCFGLFLDGVSIFEFLAQYHTDSTKVLTNLYNAQKNQFTNLYDSKVITSGLSLAFPLWISGTITA
jgi:hypothetical protein